MNPRFLFKMKRLAQNPPSMGQVKFGFAIAAICLALYGYEYFFGWPEALTPQRLPR